MKREISRRRFLGKSGVGIGTAWAAAHWPEILATQDHAHRTAQSETPVRLEFFTKNQAAEIEAMAVQIIPTDDTPGAREAHVIYFMDRALATFAASDRGVFTTGLEELQSKSKELSGKAVKFSALDSAKQIQLLKAIEDSPFFDLVRTMTVVGMFANPQYGGNKDQLGWKLIGFDDHFFFKPPFGFYDREDQSIG